MWSGSSSTERPYYNDPTAHVLHRLNAGATAVWAACDGTAPMDRITRAIEDVYSGPPGDIARDVAAVIDRFRRLGLLQRSPARATPVAETFRSDQC